MKPFLKTINTVVSFFNWLLTLSQSVLQSLILQIAANWIEQEKKELVIAKETYMNENCPKPSLSGDQATLMVRDAIASNKSFISTSKITLVGDCVLLYVDDVKFYFTVTMLAALWAELNANVSMFTCSQWITLTGWCSAGKTLTIVLAC